MNFESDFDEIVSNFLTLFLCSPENFLFFIYCPYIIRHFNYVES